MKSESHISELKLVQVAAKNIRLDPDELRHMENCVECIDRLAHLVREAQRDGSKKTAQRA